MTEGDGLMASGVVRLDDRGEAKAPHDLAQRPTVGAATSRSGAFVGFNSWDGFTVHLYGAPHDEIEWVVHRY